jgi:hypothetical protein
MEEDLFITDPAVAGTLRESFVESRLHTDAHTTYSETVVVALQDQYAGGNRAQPIYVAIDPASKRALARLDGARRTAFLPFLQRALAARN